MVKKNPIISLVLFILLCYLPSLRGTEYFAEVGNSQEPESFFSGPLELEPEPLKKKYQDQEPEPLEKKSWARARAAQKLSGSPALIYNIGRIKANQKNVYF